MIDTKKDLEIIEALEQIESKAPMQGIIGICQKALSQSPQQVAIYEAEREIIAAAVHSYEAFGSGSLDQMKAVEARQAAIDKGESHESK